jgi:Zn-dependent protease with chaperone function
VVRQRWLQGLLFFAALLILTTLADLPLAWVGHHVSLSYGISVQGWSNWLLDLAKSLGLAVLIGAPVLLLFNWIVRRWPRRYWLAAWIAALPLMVLGTFVSPLLEPVFNKFEPLAKTNPALVAQLEKVVARTGTHIPPQRFFLMKASEKTNGLNAYVSGIGSTKRIVVWDTTAGRIPDDEVLFIFGHESGHYVLNHIPKGLACYAVGLFFVFWACAGVAGWLARRFGARWGLAAPQPATENLSFVTGHDFSRAENTAKSTGALQAAEKLIVLKGHDFSRAKSCLKPTGALAPEGCFSGNSLPIPPYSAVSQSLSPLSSRAGFVVLLFTVSMAAFLLQPVDNAVSRHFEHQADVYGQEAIHGIVADPRRTAVAAFNHLGEAWLEEPDPNPFIEFWSYSHPSIQRRASFAAHYDPWANGGHGQFFEK